jgi:hypothetical protein
MNVISLISLSCFLIAGKPLIATLNIAYQIQGTMNMNAMINQFGLVCYCFQKRWLVTQKK